MKLFNLPNTLTLANLFCGSIACVIASQNEQDFDYPFTIILYLMIASLVFDFFDGFAARLTNTSGPFGAELDSLADMVSFGLLPGILMMNALTMTNCCFLIPYLAIFITLFSALRLAKFNLDTQQTYYFKGLNTPTNTILIFSIAWLIQKENLLWLSNIYILIPLTIFSCIMLIADLPLKSLKFKGFGWVGNELTFTILGVSSIGIAVFQMFAVPFIILFYIIISIIFKQKILIDGTTTE